MNAVDKLRKQVEVLREACEMLTKAYALRVDEKPVAGMRCLADATALLGKADRIAAEPVEETDAAPTWRPIAELPPEWRDGRPVLLSSNIVPGCGPFVGQWWRDGDGEDSWWCAVDATEWRDQPTHYLDLTIPEVARG